jgi:tetratricopeptide (TPR) repeat protein
LSKLPNIATYCDTYGWVLFQMGKYSLAEKELFKAVMYSNESSGEILEHYGDVLFKLNKKDGALLFWGKSKETGNHSKKLIQKISENKFIE